MESLYLAKKYKPYAQKFENTISHMYLDGNGYLTVGRGHLISKLHADASVQRLIRRASTQAGVARALVYSILSRALRIDISRNLEMHKEIDQLIPEEEISQLLTTTGPQSVGEGLENTSKISFGVLEVARETDIRKKRFLAKPIPKNICSKKLEDPIRNAFIQLLKQSIQFKATHYQGIPGQEKTKESEHLQHQSHLLESKVLYELDKFPKFEKFQGDARLLAAGFFNTTTHPGANNLVVSDEEINRLYLSDAISIIHQLKKYFSPNYYRKELLTNTFLEWYKVRFGHEAKYDEWRGFDDYPEPVQLALLDMAYNLGTHGLLKKAYFSQLVREERWDDLAYEDWVLRINPENGQSFKGVPFQVEPHDLVCVTDLTPIDDAKICFEYYPDKYSASYLREGAEQRNNQLKEWFALAASLPKPKHKSTSSESLVLRR